MAAINPIFIHNDLKDPVVRQVTVTPNDSTDLPEVSRGIAVNASGLVKFTPFGQTTPVTRYALAGVDYPWRVRRVLDAGTDAAVKSAGIIGLY